MKTSSIERRRAPRRRRDRTPPPTSSSPATRRRRSGRQPPRRVRADGDERAVGEVEDAHQPVDQRQPRGDEEVHRAEPETRDREQDEGAQCAPPWTPSSRRTCSGSARSSCGRALVDDAAAVEDDDVLREALHDAEVLLDEQRSSSARPRARAPSATSVTSSGREPLRRLVDEQERVVVQERPRDRDHLLLAARERARHAARRAPGARGRARRRGRSVASPPRSASRRFSSTVRPAKTSRSSGTYPTPRRTIACVGSRVTSSPSSVDRAARARDEPHAAPAASSSCRRRSGRAARSRRPRRRRTRPPAARATRRGRRGGRDDARGRAARAHSGSPR